MNTFKKHVMHVGEMASGAKLTVPVYSFENPQTCSHSCIEKNAPNVYIQANMHGAEVQGNAVIFQLLELLKNCDIQSNITLVPYANPVACNHKNGEYEPLDSLIYVACVVCRWFFLSNTTFYLALDKSITKLITQITDA